MSDLIHEGEQVSCSKPSGGVVEIIFNHTSSSVNKFDHGTLHDLEKIVSKLTTLNNLKGILVTSAKDSFIVGADVTEFPAYFRKPESELRAWFQSVHKLFNTFEDLPVPSVVAVNGSCLGGGCEFALACTFRVASTTAAIGLPETKLGIFPGWGGTVRLPRMIGADNAIEWIAEGSTHDAKACFKVGAVDAVVEPTKLREAALHLLQRAMTGTIDWQGRRKQKTSPLTMVAPVEYAMTFDGSKAFVAGKAGPHYPAPVEAIKVMQQAAGMSRNQACDVEIDAFVKVAHTQTASSLVSIFLSDQFNKKKVKGLAKGAPATKRAAVLGAGIMGGGIAYQSASRGIPIVMKDINTAALELGLNEATKLLTKQVERKKMDTTTMARVISAITPTLSFGDFGTVDLVVEAIIENEKIKKTVLKEVEEVTGKDTIIASNTSTISITSLAKGLKRPANFCGIHFFNPVHRMPLVEVIRGKETSDATINQAVSYILGLGKIPVVVNDCPGFLVNRVLFPYLFGFLGLVQDGVDFQRIDRVMEKFGWPMGPAYLADVIGIDTCVHAGDVMVASFPDRMKAGSKSAIHVFNEKKRYGQKNGQGFYVYTPDKEGKPKKKLDESVYSLLPALNNKTEVSEQEIIDRMMLPMINECARCLEEEIVATAMELDLALINGIGFPPFLGGALLYADAQGLDKVCKSADSYTRLGAAYTPAPLLRDLAKKGKTFYTV